LGIGPFTTVAAESVGVTRGRHRGSDLRAPFRGIRVPREAPLTLQAVCDALCTRMTSGEFFCHITAALLYGLPLPGWAERSAPLHVGVLWPRRAIKATGTVGHKYAKGSVTLYRSGDLLLASPVDVWCQLSTVLALDDLIAVGDALVRRQSPYATMAQLREAVGRYGSRRGARLLREALEWVRPGVDSPRETKLRLLLVHAGLPEPEVNGVILGGNGEFLAFGDLVFRAYRTLAEYDGDGHRSESQFHRDVDRLDNLMDETWRVVRINKSHMRGDGRVAIARVERALRRAGWTR
jgi:hypothetical protein